MSLRNNEKQLQKKIHSIRQDSFDLGQNVVNLSDTTHGFSNLLVGCLGQYYVFS